jgi:ribosomal protein S18 acetylase RimI-like enzyme
MLLVPTIYLYGMDHTISAAIIEDIPQLLRLINSAYRGEEAKKGWTHEADLIEGSLRTDEDSLVQLIQKTNAVILKCSQNKKIIGCVFLEKNDDQLYLGMLSVSPEIQAHGIGKKLLKAAEDYGKANSCHVIEMTVISIRHELIAWYERHGYHKTNTTKPFHTDHRFGVPRQQIEFIVMEKKLSDYAHH